MSGAIKTFLFFYLAVFLATGVMVAAVGSAPSSALAKALTQPDDLTGLVYAFHLMCWMVLGMLANYFWDFFNNNKKLSDIELHKLILPLLVAPLVFYTTWNLWLAEQEVSILLNIIAFQNGFFWQALFDKTKAGKGK